MGIQPYRMYLKIVIEGSSKACKGVQIKVFQKVITLIKL